jgi:polar amino acid transport system substrate-binding protein
MRHQLLKLGGAALVAWLSLAACGGTSTGNSSQGGKPAGADKTTITNWTDPRPASWSTKYPYFAPVKIGDGSLKRVQDAGKLVICSELDIPPITYTDPKTNQVVGYEVDTAKAMIKDLGIADISYVNIPFASLIPALQASNCDIAMETISIKSTRASAPGVKFTVPYIDAPYDSLNVRADSGISGLSDLKGKAVATQAGTVDEANLQQEIAKIGGGVTVRSFTGTSQCFLALTNKTVDGCWLSVGASKQALAQYPQVISLPTRYTINAKDPAAESKVNPYHYAAEAILTRSADGDLNLALSIELNAIRTSGREGEILTKWKQSQDAPPTDASFDFVNPGA